MAQCMMLVLAASVFLLGYVQALQMPSQTHVDIDGPGVARNPENDPNEDLLRAFDTFYAPRGSITNPRMLVMRGCSGSSAIMLFARTLLRLHGIPVPSAWEIKFDANGKPIPPLELEGTQAWPAELLKSRINWFYDQAHEDMGEAMRLANNKIRSYNQTLFFKGMAQEIASEKLWASLKKPFVDMKVLAVFSARANMLDQVICQIKDCFHDEYGYPADPATGEESTLCFDRRDKNIVAKSEAELLALRPRGRLLATSVSGFSADYKANVFTEDLLKHLEREENFLQDARNHLNGSVPYLEVSEEDLLEFETDIPGAMERGVSAWGKLLESFGVEPDYKVIADFIGKFAKTYPRDPPHSSLIYNWQRVKQTLKGTDYFKYWREQ